MTNANRIEGIDARHSPERNQLMKPKPFDIHAYLAEKHQIASIWSIEDVQSVRPDLSDDQAWEVLQSTRRYHDAEIGINWTVLTCHAEMQFGDAVETNEAVEA